MISTLDLLNTIIAVCLLVLTGLAGYVSYNFVQTLKSVKRVADDIEGTTKDFEIMKQGLKMGALNIASTLLSKLGGGDKNE